MFFLKYKLILSNFTDTLLKIETQDKFITYSICWLRCTLIPPRFPKNKSQEIKHKHSCFDICTEKWLIKILIFENILK